MNILSRVMNIVNWAVNMLLILKVKRGQKLTVKKKVFFGGGASPSLVPTHSVHKFQGGVRF